MKKQFIVVGLGRFGMSVAEALYESGYEVLAVDRDAERADDMQGRATHVAQADTTDPEALEALGARNFDAAIITIGSDIKASAVTTMLMKECGIPTVVAKAGDEMHGRLLTRLGADRVVYPERDMGRRVAHTIALNNILDYIEVSEDISMVEIEPLGEWIGHTLAELNLRRKRGVNVVAIRTGERVNVSVSADTAIGARDVLLVVGQREAIAKIERDN